METKQYHGFLRHILLENVLCILAAYTSYQKSKIKGSFFNDTGYPQVGRADKDSYPHNGRADKDSYLHDRHNQYIMLSL